MNKKPMSNFVNPRIRFGGSVPEGTARMFAEVGDDPSVAVTFDASTGTVTLDSNSASVTVKNKKVTIAFDLTINNLPANNTVEIAGIEFSKPNEPSGTFDASNVFEDPSTFTDQGGNAHTVYGKWKNGQHKLEMVDDNNVPAGGTDQDYGYKVWVKMTPQTGTANYYASPDPQVKNQPTT